MYSTDKIKSNLMPTTLTGMPLPPSLELSVICVLEISLQLNENMKEAKLPSCDLDTQ